MSNGERSDRSKISEKSNSWTRDLRTYIIFALLSSVLLFYSISEIRPVIVNVEDFLGLMAHLTWAYWIGFLLITIFSVRLYLDNDDKGNGIYLIYLIVVGLFLFGVPIFAEENAWFAWSYYPTGEVKNIIENGKISDVYQTELGAYYSWPGSHFVSTFIVYFTDIKIDDLAKYMPIFWVLSVILITYSTGRLFGLRTNQCFLISFFVVSSFWTINSYYGPQSLAYVLYLLFFGSIALVYSLKDGLGKRSGKRSVSVVLIILAFIGVVITHMITSIALITSFFFSSRFVQSIDRNRVKFIILFAAIFAGWYMYFATLMLNVGIRDFLEQIISGEFFNVFASEKYDVGNTLIREIIHYVRISYLMIYAALMLIAVIFYLKDKVPYKDKELFRVCLFWFIGLLVLLPLRYGAEIDDRVYILSLLPMSVVLVMTFGRKTLAVLAIVLIGLHIPAHYGTEGSYMVKTTELQGSEFVAQKVGKDDAVNYYYTPLIRYYNDKFVNSRGFKSGYYNPDNKSLEGSTYIISSVQLDDYLIYVFGENKIKRWLDDNKNRPTLLYNNGYYMVYKNLK